MTPGEVIAAIQEQNVQVVAGKIGGVPTTDKQQLQYTLQAKGRLENISDFENIIVRAKTVRRYGSKMWRASN